MQLPEHPFVIGLERVWSQHPSGGWVGDRIVLTTNIKLNPSDLGYDAEKVAELDKFAYEYMKVVEGRYKEVLFKEQR